MMTCPLLTVDFEQLSGRSGVLAAAGWPAFTPLED
jgi:hypothetical protein